MSRPKTGTYNECLVCKKEFYARPYEKDRRHCSNKCVGVSQRVSKQSRICKKCSTRYEVYPSDPKEFCGRDCYDQSRLEASLGSRKTNSDGYVLVKRPDSPIAQPSTGYVFEHRLVMSEHLERPLFTHETPHHKNGVRDDNSLDNLELWSVSQPAGQRVQDKIDWAIAFLSEYGTVEYTQKLIV